MLIFSRIVSVLIEWNLTTVEMFVPVFSSVNHKILFYFLNISREVWVASHALPGKGISWFLEMLMGT